MRPRPAYIEIVERVPAPPGPGEPGPRNPPGPMDYVIPNEVRLNGIPLAVPADEAIEVHGISLHERDIVKVTLTLFARYVAIGPDQPVDPPDAR